MRTAQTFTFRVVCPTEDVFYGILCLKMKTHPELTTNPRSKLPSTRHFEPFYHTNHSITTNQIKKPTGFNKGGKDPRLGVSLTSKALKDTHADWIKKLRVVFYKCVFNSRSTYFNTNKTTEHQREKTQILRSKHCWPCARRITYPQHKHKPTADWTLNTERERLNWTESKGS